MLNLKYSKEFTFISQFVSCMLVLYFELNIIEMSAALRAALSRLPCMYIVVLVTIPHITRVVYQKFHSDIEISQTQQKIFAITYCVPCTTIFPTDPVEKHSPKGKNFL